MAISHIDGIKIIGLSAAVPKDKKDNLSDPHVPEAEKLVQSTGIRFRRISNTETCTSDLCITSAKSLLSKANISKDQIQCLVFVTQTPDYYLPATSILIQNKLELNSDVVAIDISLGCSGYVYGLAVISSLMKSLQLEYGLLLVGDTISKICNPNDKSTYPLFGDAGTATLLKLDNEAKGFKFHLENDGKGSNAIQVKAGAFRNMSSPETLIENEVSEGIKRNDQQLLLDGMDVFTFGISKAPDSVNKLLSAYDLNKDNIDYYVFHQANMFMNEKIRKKLNLEEARVPYSMMDYGNTSSATIPITIVSQLRNSLLNSRKEFIACGFGVGLSWGSVWFELNNCIVDEIIEHE